MANQLTDGSADLAATSLQIQVASDIDSLLVFIAIVFMALVTYFGTLPYRVSAFTQNKFLKAMGNTFAGAIFFNVAMLHILPDANRAMENHFNPEGTNKQSFPLAFLLMIVGFLLTVLLTKVIGGHQHQHQHEQKQKHSSIRQIQMKVIQDSSLSENIIQSQGDLLKSKKQEIKKSKRKQILLLTSTIYLHTLFEGVSIGVQSSSVSLLSTSLAIGLHKWADAFSIGMFYKNKGLLFTKAYMLIGLQALMNGMAIGIGWFVQSKGEFFQAVFLSISAGTFLGLSIMHILNEQLNNKRYIWYKFAVLILATLLVVCISGIEQSFGQQSQ